MTTQSFLQTTEMKIPTVTAKDAKEYFLNFSTREEYLVLRAEWRALYAYLSQAIRSNKNRFRTTVSWRAKIAYRMAKAQGLQGTPLQLAMRQANDKEWAAEYAARTKMATRNVPPAMDELGHNATDLLDIRLRMKLLAGAQRLAQKRELSRVTL
jgi:hypothetical protein